MVRKRIVERVTEMVAYQAAEHSSDVKPEHLLIELGLDSLDCFDLAQQMEQEFGVSFTYREERSVFNKNSSINQVADAVEQKLNEPKG